MTKNTIEIGNVWSTLTTDNDQLIQIVREESGFMPEGWQHIKMNRLEAATKAADQRQIDYWRDWDGVFYLSRLFDNKVSFPTGLLDRIEMRFEIEVEDKVENTLAVKAPLFVGVGYDESFKPRDYQQECVRDILNKGIHRGIIKAPTGSGKTIIGAMLIKEFYVPTLIIVDKTVLMDQWIEALGQVLDIAVECDVGAVRGKSMWEPSFITIITQQSLNRWRTKDRQTWNELMGIHPKGWIQVIRDEVHHAGSQGGYDTMMDIPAFFRWGFSATPDMRQDQNLKQIACIGEIIFNVGADRLIADEFLARPNIQFVPVPRMYFDWYDRYPKVYKEGIVHNEDRNEKLIHIAGTAGWAQKQVLIFVDLIEHGMILEAKLQDVAPMYGISVEFVFGNHKDREGCFERFKSRQTQVLIATEGLIGEGFDYKGIDVVIIGDGGKSGLQTIQKMGRGMRVTETKRTVDVIDFADRCKYLGGHAKQRYQTWVSWGFEPDITNTPWIGD